MADVSGDCLNLNLVYGRCVFDFSDCYILTQNSSTNGQTDIIGMATYEHEVLPLVFKVTQLKRGVNMYSNSVCVATSIYPTYPQYFDSDGKE